MACNMDLLVIKLYHLRLPTVLATAHGKRRRWNTFVRVGLGVITRFVTPDELKMSNQPFEFAKLAALPAPSASVPLLNQWSSYFTSS